MSTIKEEVEKMETGSFSQFVITEEELIEYLEENIFFNQNSGKVGLFLSSRSAEDITKKILEKRTQRTSKTINQLAEELYSKSSNLLFFEYRHVTINSLKKEIGKIKKQENIEIIFIESNDEIRTIWNELNDLQIAQNFGMKIIEIFLPPPDR